MINDIEWYYGDYLLGMCLAERADRQLRCPFRSLGWITLPQNDVLGPHFSRVFLPQIMFQKSPSSFSFPLLLYPYFNGSVMIREYPSCAQVPPLMEFGWLP